MSAGVRILSALLLAAGVRASGEPRPKGLAPPVVEGKWVRPATGQDAQPVWGIRDGIRVGLWPTPGPRGLIRIYAPYLGHPPRRMINYIAVEPNVGKIRGYSELESSRREGLRGKAMWTADAREPEPRPRTPTRPARGRIRKVDGAETLTFFLFVEPFRNGARPIVEATLRNDQRQDVAFRVFAAKGSAPMQACVLTATMGNYARLRHLWLRGEVVDARRLWPTPTINRFGFTGHRQWGLERMLVVDGRAIVAAMPDEADPASAAYAKSVPRAWRYRGEVATQYWRARAQKGLVVQVNGRKTYWASQAPIPGGIAYENFELVAPFADGQTFVFGVSPKPPEALGFDEAWRHNVTDGR
ncbi:MAG: hypothetical protein ACODAJ_06670 [Planctomycetota bacterium]